MREPFARRANEALTSTREGRGNAGEGRRPSSGDEEDEGREEDEQLRRALEESKREHERLLREKADLAHTGAAGGDDLVGLNGEDSFCVFLLSYYTYVCTYCNCTVPCTYILCPFCQALALRLSQDPTQQISSDVRDMIKAITESQRDNHRQRQVEADEEEDEQVRRAKDKSLREAEFAEIVAPLAEAQELKRLPGARRPIVIDGNNVGWAHGNFDRFSAKGVLICIQYFSQRGHDLDDINAFVYHNQRNGVTVEDRALMEQLARTNLIKLVSKKHYDDL